jgi:hypothetical protein
VTQEEINVCQNMKVSKVQELVFIIIGKIWGILDFYFMSQIWHHRELNWLGGVVFFFFKI